MACNCHTTATINTMQYCPEIQDIFAYNAELEDLHFRLVGKLLHQCQTMFKGIRIKKQLMVLKAKKRNDDQKKLFNESSDRTKKLMYENLELKQKILMKQLSLPEVQKAIKENEAYEKRFGL